MPTETEIANLAGGKIGGFGDQATAAGFIETINGTDKISKWCKTLLPECRKQAIIDLTIAGCPPREAIKYADLGAEVAEESLPEIGGWEYAFNLPSDCIAVSKLLDEDFTSTTEKRTEYQFETIVNKTNNGRLLLTNDLTNADGTGAFIEYVIDQTNPAAFSKTLKNCIVLLLAAELCPLVGKDPKLRNQLLIEYEQLTKPSAKKYNQSQFNNYAKSKPGDYFGGRGQTTIQYNNAETDQ
ncbi:MAG: hypothetical protein PHY02_09555 [Phycisphaerae bacterium]|nr:hypothetical protein [Phycisphaerae bacterium]